MIEWTEPARRALNEYCARSKRVLAGSGADADEVSDDLRRHIEEEVRASRIAVVTEEVVRRILARVGDPADELSKFATRADPKPESEPARSITPPRPPGQLLLFLTVILPLITIGVELTFGLSAGVLFDPMPRWFHLPILLLVPVSNFFAWRAARMQDGRHTTLLGWLNSAAIGVSLFYAVLYIPFTPIAGIALIYFGAGLIPLAPLIAAMTTPILRSRLAARIGTRLPGDWKGAALAITVLVLLQLPSAVTYYGLARAASDDSSTRRHGIRVLRAFGDEELMLRACYGLLRQRDLNMDLVRLVASGDQNISAEQARETFYRVTGKAFNSFPPPAMYTRQGRWTGLEQEFTWDDALGGEAVAGQVKGLSLLSSQMDAVAEPAASLVYCEWTMEFKNVASIEREARAQIALPPGSVVSRVTLWIDGEEREAAFGRRAQVRKAYEEVAVVQRRDPILVTTCGPDRVLMQCFPVPRNGGVMKVKLGITAPLLLESVQQGQFVWPRFLERNLGIARELKHERWIRSPDRLNDVVRANGRLDVAIRESVFESAAWSGAGAITVYRPDAVQSVWTPGTDGQVVRQVIREIRPEAVNRVVLVLDGSEAMRAVVGDVVEALSDLPNTIELAVIVAGDTVENVLGPPRSFSGDQWSDVRRRLQRHRFAGGQDNVPALENAWDLASASSRGAVLWVHEPEPVLLSPETGLRQRINHDSTGTRLFELQTSAGPDRVVEKLDGLVALNHVPRTGSIREDMKRVVSEISGGASRFELFRERVGAAAQNDEESRASRHVARLWARDEAQRLATARKKTEAAALAAEHQLVTPLTGAVVLETQEQFAAHDLTPADPNTVPSVPEPQAAAIALLALALWRLTTRRKLGAVSK